MNSAQCVCAAVPYGYRPAPSSRTEQILMRIEALPTPLQANFLTLIERQLGTVEGSAEFLKGLPSNVARNA